MLGGPATTGITPKRFAAKTTETLLRPEDDRAYRLPGKPVPAQNPDLKSCLWTSFLVLCRAAGESSRLFSFRPPLLTQWLWPIYFFIRRLKQVGHLIRNTGKDQVF